MKEITHETHEKSWRPGDFPKTGIFSARPATHSALAPEGMALIPFALELLRQMDDWSPPVRVKAILVNGEWQLLVRTDDPNDFWTREEEHKA